MSLPISCVSSSALEPWSWETPWTTGIGGSEISHCEMVKRLALRGLPISSYAPVSFEGTEMNHTVPWTSYKNWLPKTEILINYRNPSIFDANKPPGARWWFVAQDVDYLWTSEQLEKVDRYLCLCKQHSTFTLRKYPQLQGRVYISSNGVRSSCLNTGKFEEGLIRQPHRMFYGSSPDRGLLLVLKNWFRIREAVPDAELYIGYGFENFEKIVQMNGHGDWRFRYKQELEALMHQDGIHWVGRLSQSEVYKQWFKASILPSPTDFPETFGINYCDAQACGCFPVTNAFWAVGEYVQFGTKLSGIPQKSTLGTALWVAELIRALKRETEDPVACSGERARMMAWSRENFDWNNVTDQWETWIKKDSQN